MQEAGVVSLGWDHVPAVGVFAETGGGALHAGELAFSLLLLLLFNRGQNVKTLQSLSPFL